MLLDDLLAYSRVGRADDEIVEVNARELVQDIFASSANKDFRLILADDLPVLQTKKVPLELVFRNLIGNAIKHHDKAQGTIHITVRRATDGIEFEVKDDGPGIPLEHQQRVFAMFQTLKPRDEIEGSGIGLALVKKAVESMGGAITLESDGHQGCSFKFTWPTISHQS
jgi:signal transduction histidine kinase